ncbi:acyltransferase family protein [Hyphomicrobium sp.]|uniref:acyltransferase family protein n=1 Tax=Hyphomicrobium sp. TaxID=82 RepID=UPI0025C2F5F4|nr:acyltransferase family protein [Hyphomicrobium sp.]MCC7251593.1 acyltransferase [Hyphomicrobium sp.]
MSRASPVESASLPYLPHVDGLRALAVALVVVFHAWPSVLPGGFVGVDVFFVISGFIITRQIAADMEQGNFSYAGFLGRRARRLVPAAAVCCLLVTAVSVLVLMPDALSTYSESLIAVWTMTANIYFYLNSGYFDAPSAEAPLLHMWSLAVVDQFYLTWPLLLLLMVRKLVTRPRIVAAALALAVLSLVHSELSARSDANLAFYLPLSRAFELIAGCALALALPFIKAPTVSKRAVLDFAGLVLVTGSAAALHAGISFPGLAAVPAIVGSVLLIAAGLFGPTPVSRLLSLKPVVLTGKMSYSIYLYHWPALALAAYWLGRGPDAPEAAALVAVSLILAALSWLLVEQALTRRMGLYTLPPAALFKRTAAAGTAFAVLAAVGILGRGLPQRLDVRAYEVYRAASQGNPLRRSCDGHDLAFRHTPHCTFGAPLAERASYDIAVFGDSNADHFVPMIAELAGKAGLSGRQVTQSTCPPLIGVGYHRPTSQEETCARYQETIVEFLDQNPGLKIAILSWSWTDETPVANRVADLSAARDARTFGEFTAATVAIFRKRGIKVLIIGQVPHFQTFSLRCLAQAARKDTEEVDCTVPREEVDRDIGPYQAAIEDIDRADDGVSFLDMRALLCSDVLCSAFKDDVLLYRDRGHLNALGSAYLARYASLPELDAK